MHKKIIFHQGNWHPMQVWQQWENWMNRSTICCRICLFIWLPPSDFRIFLWLKIFLKGGGGYSPEEEVKVAVDDYFGGVKESPFRDWLWNIVGWRIISLNLNDIMYKNKTYFFKTKFIFRFNFANFWNHLHTFNISFFWIRTCLFSEFSHFNLHNHILITYDKRIESITSSKTKSLKHFKKIVFKRAKYKVSNV